MRKARGHDSRQNGWNIFSNQYGPPEAALFQVPCIAKARNMPEDRMRQIVNGNIQGRSLGFLGEPRVNVLALNLALDQAAGK